MGIVKPFSGPIEPLEPLSKIEGRSRGDYLGAGSFLFYYSSKHQRAVVALEPRSLAPGPKDLRDHVSRDPDDLPTSPWWAGGYFSPTSFDFTLLVGVALDEIPRLFARLVVTLRQDERTDFDRYMSAQILVRSQTTSWGTIQDAVSRQLT